MANYRTYRELNPYKGKKITRLHKDGSWYYFVGERLDTKPVGRTLKEAKHFIDCLFHDQEKS